MGIQKKKKLCVSASASLNMDIFISNKKDEPVVSEIKEISKILSEKPKVQQTIQTERDQTTKKEIIWSLYIVSC
jgi:hypothetical protein